MEFTVSKSDLVRELSLSQGVVEKKTTIPILSNVLIEAAGDRVTLTATDLELGIRCSCPARVKKEGAGTVPARKLLDYVRLLPEGDVHDEVSREPLGEHHVRPVQNPHRRHVAREFPRVARDAGGIAEIPMKTAFRHDRAHHVRHLDGRVAFHLERRAAADSAGRPHHGLDRRPPAGVCRGLAPPTAATRSGSSAR